MALALVLAQIALAVSESASHGAAPAKRLLHGPWMVVPELAGGRRRANHHFGQS